MGFAAGRPSSAASEDPTKLAHLEGLALVDLPAELARSGILERSLVNVALAIDQSHEEMYCRSNSTDLAESPWRQEMLVHDRRMKRFGSP